MSSQTSTEILGEHKGHVLSRDTSRCQATFPSETMSFPEATLIFIKINVFIPKEMELQNEVLVMDTDLLEKKGQLQLISICWKKKKA